ncbi:MAG TPA: hypothetical protein PLS10_06395 [Chitinophagales bacterium]|nr:hypothetical protein [Chitinophagales bacterium]
MNLKFSLTFATVCTLFFYQTTAKPTNPKDIPSKITIYAEDGEKFVLYVNGIKQNIEPLSKVEVNDLKGAIVKVNAVFANPALAPVAKSIIRMAKDCEYAISKNKKGEYVINMKTAGTLGTSVATPKITITDTQAVIKQPIVSQSSGSTTLAQTDPSKSTVMVNGRPADASVKVDNNTGKVTLGAKNDKGEGAAITIDPAKLTNIKGNLKEPEVKIGGMTTDEFSNGMDKVGDGIGNSFDTKNTNISANDDNANVTVSTSEKTTPQKSDAQLKMEAQMKETEDAATAAMNNAANHGPIVPGTFTFFSEDGDTFTVFMDDVKQNEVPQSKVVVNNVLSSSLRSKIVFENTAIPSIEKKGMRIWRNYTFIIKKNKKGKYELDTNGNGDLYGR